MSALAMFGNTVVRPDSKIVAETPPESANCSRRVRNDVKTRDSWGMGESGVVVCTYAWQAKPKVNARSVRYNARMCARCSRVVVSKDT